MCELVLVGLANHAGPDGTGAFPSVARPVRYTGLSDRTVRSCLDRLAAAGIISPCVPAIVAAWIKRADRRPQGWDLNLRLVRNNLDDAAVTASGHLSPPGGGLPATAGSGADGPGDGVQSLHPVAIGSEAVDNSHNGVQQLHPEREGGATSAPTRCDRFDIPWPSPSSGTLQLELLGQQFWETRHLANAIFERIEAWYNPARRHSSLATTARLTKGCTPPPEAAA